VLASSIVLLSVETDSKNELSLAWIRQSAALLSVGLSNILRTGQITSMVAVLVYLLRMHVRPIMQKPSDFVHNGWMDEFFTAAFELNKNQSTLGETLLRWLAISKPSRPCSSSTEADSCILCWQAPAARRFFTPSLCSDL
jgi:hypothetical protein